MIAAARTRWRQVAGRVLGQTDQGAGHAWLEIEVPDAFETPAPGQFVQLLLRETDSAALLPRPMSVAGVRERAGTRVLGFLYAPIGLGTWSLARLGKGHRVDVLGPLGRGFDLAAPGTPVLVAGGRGVAPLLFMADALAKRAPRGASARGRPACEFVFGARSRAYLVGLADARRRLQRLGGRLHVSTDDGSAGARGTVMGPLERIAARAEEPLVIHACGPHGMLAAVARWSLERGFRAHLAMEALMACGTGVCRGCPLPRSDAGRAASADGVRPSLFGNAEYAMCCTEGPVFEASELDWSRIE